MKPIMADSAEWREVNEKLARLSDGQIAIEGRMDAFSARQKEQHEANSKDIAEMKATLNGIPGDTENIGLTRTVDRALTYAKSSAFWMKALVTGATLIGLYLGILVTYLVSRLR